MNKLNVFFRFNEVEIDNEIKLTKEAIDEASSDLRRLQCLLQLLEDEKEKIKNEKI